MSTYSEISDDYLMFETKMPVDYHDSIENYVSTEDMFRHMFNVLLEYDRCMSDKRDAKINPMSGRVSMRLENGLEFQIPEDIQKIAILKFIEMKKNAKENSEVTLQEQVAKLNRANGNNVQEEPCLMSKLLNVNNARILAIIICILLVCLVYKYYNEPSVPSIPRFEFDF